jgi:hypothetical protein
VLIGPGQDIDRHGGLCPDGLGRLKD